VVSPASLADLDDIYELHADERVWRHFPQGRHRDVEQTRARVLAMQNQWSRYGLGYWVARVRVPVGDLPAGSFAGIGGCGVESGARWWNLYYRFRPEAQGHGLAAELAQLAVATAHSVAPDRPVVARLLEINVASRATAERTGLLLQRRGPEPGVPGVVRLIYADCALEPDLLDAITN
jgi:RimJ/RimL family protein N-acetyltransferase